MLERIRSNIVQSGHFLVFDDDDHDAHADGNDGEDNEQHSDDGDVFHSNCFQKCWRLIGGGQLEKNNKAPPSVVLQVAEGTSKCDTAPPAMWRRGAAENNKATCSRISVSMLLHAWGGSKTW